MREMTGEKLTRLLLQPRTPGDQTDLVQRVEALTTLVLDLLVEVDALRRAQAAAPGYRDVYREACLLAHDSAGVTSGAQKTLERFYPEAPAADGRVWREAILLQRLGATAAEIDAFKREAEDVEQYT